MQTAVCLPSQAQAYLINSTAVENMNWQFCTVRKVYKGQSSKRTDAAATADTMNECTRAKLTQHTLPPRAGVTKLRPAGQIRPAKPFHPARVDILLMRKNNITKENLLIWQKHFLKQSHFVRCPALGLLSNSLCGLRTKKFGDPCSSAIVLTVNSLYTIA